MNKIFILAVISIISTAVHAQTGYRFTLQQCVDSALRKNINVRESKLASDAAHVNMQQAKSSQLPAVYGNANQAMNFGRNIDPFTNDYINRTIGYGSYGVTGEVIVFNGNNIRNSIRKAENEAVASRADLQFNRQEVTLNVLLAYMQVLNIEEQLNMTRRQTVLSNEQLKKLALKNKKGVAATSQATDLKGQLLNDSLAIIELQNNLEWYKMELAQQMNIPYNKDIVLAKLNVDEMLQPYRKNSQEVYNTALNDFPAVKAAELRTDAAQYGLKAAKGLRYPQVFAGGNVQTVYASTAADYLSEKVAFPDQFLNNRSANVVVGLRIPIVSGNIKSGVRLADINVRNAQLKEEKTKMEVWQQIERAHVAMTNAYTRFQTLSSQIAAYNTSFTAAQARFDTGIDGSVSYLIAKSNLDRANVNLINAKYDFIMKKKTLDYFQNIR